MEFDYSLHFLLASMSWITYHVGTYKFPLLFWTKAQYSRILPHDFKCKICEGETCLFYLVLSLVPRALSKYE